MKDFVTQSNIERFEKLLADETDVGKAKTLRALLSTERERAVAALQIDTGHSQSALPVPKG